MDLLNEKKFSNRRLKADAANPFAAKFYYPSLDGLRFFGFLLVFLHHVYQTTYTDNPVGNFFVTIFRTNGWVGVDLFLILSGFLVTTLLLKEKIHHGSFSIKDFQRRRILRIWPLYYLALILGFFIVPFIAGQLGNLYYVDQIKKEFWWHFFFLGNWYTIFNDYSIFRNISLLWTISLEQQFYFIWPFILLTVNRFRTALFYCLSLILFAILLRYVLFQFNIQHPDVYVNTFTRFDTLAYGALLAVINLYHPNWKNYLKPFLNFPLQVVVFISFLGFLFITGEMGSYIIRHSIWGYVATGIFMLYFIVSALNTNSLYTKILENKTLVWLGKIGYGLYVYHIMGLELTRFLIGKTAFAFLEPIVALAITIFFSWISYKFFEVRFLKLKNKFTKISTRPI